MPDDRRQIFVELWSEDRGLILVTVSLGWFFSLGSRLIYPIILPQLMAEYQITYGTAGVALSALWLSYAVVNLPGGMVADYLGERLLLALSMAVTVVGVVAVVLAPTFAAFLGATVVLGVGTGLFGTTGTTVLTDIYSTYDTTAISISQIAGTVGTIVIPVVAGVVTVGFGWRAGVSYVLPGFVLVGFGLWYALPTRTSPLVDPAQRSSLDVVRDIYRTLSDRHLLLLVGGMTAVGFVYQGLTGFLPSYLIETKELSQRNASLLFGLLFVSMMVGKMVSGTLSNRYGDRATLVGFTAVSVPAIVILPLVDTSVLLVLTVWFAGLILGYTPVATTYAMEFIPGEIQGSVFGVIRMIFLGVGALAPPVVGFLADAGLFDVAFFMLGAFAIAAVGLSILLPADRSLT